MIFTASWSEASDRFVETTLEAPESVGVISACFETVRLDVDAHAELARRMQVTRIPLACVMDANERLLFQFECSESSADFVTYAARAVQHASAARSVASQASIVPSAIPVASAFSPPAAAMAGVAVQRSTEPRTTHVSASASPWIDDRGSVSATGQAAQAAGHAAVSYPGTERGFMAGAGFSGPVAGTTSVPPPVFPGLPATPPPAAPAATSYPVTSHPYAAGAAGVQQKPRKPWESFVAAFKPVAPKKDPVEGGAIIMPTPGLVSQPAASSGTQSNAANGITSLGLNGYCPVSLVEKGVWLAGNQQFGARHRGRTYLFTGLAEQQAFLASPDRYAPALAGDDPVVAIDAGSQIAGNPRYGVTFQSRVYLFSSPQTLNTFMATPERYVRGVAIAEQPASPGQPSFVR